MQTQISCTVFGGDFDPFQVSKIPSFLNSNFGVHSNFGFRFKLGIYVQWKAQEEHNAKFEKLPQHRSFIHCESPIASWVQRTNYAVPNTLRPWCGGAGPRARVKTTRCRSAGLGPVGPKGLACLNESWNVIVYPLRIFRRCGIHICHENDSWNMGLFTGAGH